MRVEHTVTLSCPIAEAFAFLALPSNLPAWVDGVLRARQISAGAPGLGATMETLEREAPHRVGRGRRVWEVIEYEPPHALACRTIGESRSVEMRYTLEAVPSGTRLTVAADMMVEGLFKPSASQSATATRRALAAALETLVALLGGQATVCR